MGLQPLLRADAPMVALLDPATEAWAADLRFAEGSGWLQTPEGAAWFAEALQAKVRALGLPAPPAPAQR